VGSVCYLLRAGLSEQVIKALADWSSDQIWRYARKVMFDLELVEPWAFYNPQTGCYTDKPAYSRPPMKPPVVVVSSPFLAPPLTLSLTQHLPLSWVTGIWVARWERRRGASGVGRGRAP